MKLKRRLALSLSLAATVVAVLAPATQAGTATIPVKVTDFPSTSTDAGRGGQFHAIAVNPKTGAQIAFYRADSTGSDPYLGAQRFDSDGPVGSEHVIATGGTYAQTYYGYAIAYNPTTGGWLVAYPDYDANQMLAQLLNANGSLSGSSFVIGEIVRPNYAGVDISWNSNSKKFLVAFTSYDDTPMEARFVTGSGAVSGAQFTAMSDIGNDYVPMDTAYSSKSNTFLVEAFDNQVDRVRVQLLSGSGSPIGVPRYLGGEDWSYNYAASVAYNAKRDEFGVVWNAQPADPGPYKLYLQRIKASNGVDVGGEVEIAPPEGMEACCYRTWLSSSPTGNYYVSTYVYQGTSPYSDGWYSFQFGATGATAADSLEEINGVQNVNRPQTLYNPATRRFVTTFSASECEPILASALRSARGGACTNIYNLYSIGAGSSGGGGSKPSAKKVGTPGGTSARVKLGCGGSGKCTIELTGKLKGGSGKIIAKTVKVKAGKKATVKVAYSQELIDELAANGGGKIRLTAKQAGGKSKTITLVVPASVTG